MKLRDWRLAGRMSLADLAAALGLAGVNPMTTVGRIELGSRQPDADMVERIERLTDGAVTAADMHAARLAWLKDNRPDKFQRPATLDDVHGAASQAADGAGLSLGGPGRLAQQFHQEPAE